MSGKDGKQLSIEEAVHEADSMPKDKTPPLNEKAKAEVALNEKSATDQKARSRTKGKKGKQLAQEETLDEPKKEEISPQVKLSSKRSTRSTRQTRQTKLEESLDS